jgi:hypothetical protein
MRDQRVSIDDIQLTKEGEVIFPGGYMYLDAFRRIAGEAPYQALLAKPRVQFNARLELGRPYYMGPMHEETKS